MSKTLIIAEKPSVASYIAHALGDFTKYDEFYEREDFIVSSAIGHLLEISPPKGYEVQRGKWNLKNLPIIPPNFSLNPIEKNKSRLNILTKLIKRKDIDRLINACDAGREGELIFCLIVQYAKTKHPVQRLWLQSMTPAAIRNSFSNLRTESEMKPLADAARCRLEADWLVGINGTRAITAFNNKDGGFFLTTVGRVQTPTLSIVVEREDKIKQFIPRDYWEVHARFICSSGFYKAIWFDPNFKHIRQSDPEKRDSRLWSLQAAENVIESCRDQIGMISEKLSSSTQLSPKLYNLTSLQREANSRFGFSAKSTLGLAQILYEKHKILTYPRTDARVLPEDYLSIVKSTFNMLAENNYYLPFAKKVIDENWVKMSKRIFDNEKINDHFAIIPTLQTPKTLSEPEKKLYDLVVKRFIAVFFPAAEYKITTRITEVASNYFKTEGNILVCPGWMQVYNRENKYIDKNLVSVDKNEKVRTGDVIVHKLTTKPLAQYSEATLLSAMEGAGKFIEDEEFREAMSAKGLGTPATRAGMIEGLINERYLVREGRLLIPTAKAFQLITLLRHLEIKELTAPELTGEWEYKLSQIERGQLARHTFMQEISCMTQTIVKHIKEYDSNKIISDYITLNTLCPNCSGEVRESYRRFSCTKCKFYIPKILGNRQFEISEIEELLKRKNIGPLSGFHSKLGRPFSAILKLSFNRKIENYRLEFDFSQDQSDESLDFSLQKPIGSCPKCHNGYIFEYGMNYICNHSVCNLKTCDFRSGKLILQQEITREQMKNLLEKGKTDLLPNFKSLRTGRNFMAYLVIKTNGEISFEFKKREKKNTALKEKNKTH